MHRAICATLPATSIGSLDTLDQGVAISLSRSLVFGLLRNYCNQPRRAAELEQLFVEARRDPRTPQARKPAPARNDLPADIVKAIIHEYSRGASLYKLAARHQVRRNTVRDVLRRNGIQICEGNTVKLSPEQKEDIRAKRAGGATMRALGEEFEVSESTIKRALNAPKAA